MPKLHLNLHSLLSLILSGLLLCMLSFNATAAGVEQQVREHYTQLLDARQRFEQALANGELNQTEQADYQAWIQQLDDGVIRACRQLGAADRAALPPDLPCEQMMSQHLTPANINTSAESTDSEKTALIVDQLSISLGKFDEQLLQEQERIKAKTPNTNASASGGNSGGTNSESGTGSSSEDGATTSQTESGQQNAPQKNQDQTGDNTTTAVRPGQAGAPRKTATGEGEANPENIPDGHDDDVVARQIREAAKKEQDPVLKEKLWEEYRRYKAGTR